MSDTTQFLVHWDEHPTHITSRLGYLLEHQSHVDVTLMCNTHTLKVHRAVLAASSPYFERQLGNHPLIVLKDMKFSVLKSLVEFMYCGETSVTEDNLTPLLEAAKFFEVKGLSSMTKETVCGPSSSSKSINGNTTPTTSNFSRGRGRGRGRGRPPLNMSTPAKASSPTEPAHILLSLSGTPASQIFNSKKDPPSSSSDKSLTPKFAFEPRRRGRKRGAVNSAFRDRLLREADTHLAIENLKRDLSDSNDYDSPLLSSLLNKNKTENKYLKDSTSGIDSEDQKSVTMLSLSGSKSIDDATFQSMKNGAVSEAENEPEAVVLYEVTGDQQVEKHVLSAKEIDLLKSLNEELTNQKRELSSLPENDEKSAELRVKIDKTKAVLSQVVGHIKDKLKCAFPDQNNKKSQMVQLEFIDGNGEKIEGYQVTGTVVDKKEPKEEYGLFNMVCPNTSPLIGGDDKKSFQLEDNSQMYEIGAMMNDSNVGEDKNQDFKYIIDNDSNMMNQEDNFIVYESENVIYDGSQMPIGAPGDYIVSDEVVYNDDGTEYVEYNDKDLEIKEINESYNFSETESRQETETKRMNSFSGCKRRASTSSDSSDRPARRRKNDPTLLQALNEESL